MSFFGAGAGILVSWNAGSIYMLINTVLVDECECFEINPISVVRVNGPVFVVKGLCEQ